MKSINSILSDYLEIFNSYLNPTKVSSTNKLLNESRNNKINKVINQITGDGINNKKIINIVADVSEGNEIKETKSLSGITEKTYQKPTIHEFYSPSNEF
jgi:16S rRNA C1402 N4-methylase RsmH